MRLDPVAFPLGADFPGNANLTAHVAHPAAHRPDRMFARSGGMRAGFTEFQRTVETAPVIFPIVRRPFQHLEVVVGIGTAGLGRSEEHTSELQSLMRISYAVFCSNKNTEQIQHRLAMG